MGYERIITFLIRWPNSLCHYTDLEAETSVSSEVALYWSHPDGHNFNVTIFKNDFDDKIASQPCGKGTSIECSDAGEYADLGYAVSSKTVNIDKVTIQGAELAGRWEILDALTLNANYTYTDSEQKSGAEQGRPLGNSAKHMANATLKWELTDSFNVFLTSEYRAKRYRSWDIINDAALYYKGYNVFHLGGSYQASEFVTFNMRVNNLFDKDFTSYDIVFTECSDTSTTCVSDDNGQNGYTASYVDDFNNKDKARNFWVGMNVRF
ncbi:TonB-dependent receptor domain-containing protein [Shewanella oncorhynchi]|uniref:TonB-dependent receptor domain-containing protein n=1 Tax=Shewanella oncorhynchi TaxID=2726434 RepID=UPI003D79C6B9